MTAQERGAPFPGALRPVQSDDGLIVGVRPFGGRLRRAQADGIASLAAAHGNGLIDLSARGTLQIHGVREQKHAALIEGLRVMGLIDPTPEIEGRRNLLVSPFWQPGDETEMIAAALTDALTQQGAPGLPPQFSFAIDAGRAPVLQAVPADIRFECDAGGGLILVADGMEAGKPVAVETAVADAIHLAAWFVAQAGGAMNMKSVIASGGRPSGAFVPRQRKVFVPAPGYTPNGAIVGIAGGRMRVETLSTLAKHGGLRLTPWGLLLVESARELPDIEGIITDPFDPRLPAAG